VSAEIVELYRDWQHMLARYGDGQAAFDVFFKRCNRIEEDPCLDNEGFQAALERLHCKAYPDAATRPTRLIGAEISDPRE
jgi:hypothetical protein